MVTRDSGKTRAKILAAATQAFVRSGPAGARVDAIAAAAGVNKRMLYHHFGDKQGLYQAVLAASADEQGLFSEARARLLAWEGLSNSAEAPSRVVQDPEVPGSEKVATMNSTKSASIDAAIETVSESKSKEGLDAQMFALLQTALQVFPHVCGPEVQRLTGLAPDSEAFDAALSRLREQVQQQLDPKVRVQAPKAKVTLRARSTPRT